LAIGASPVSVDALDKTSLYGKDPNLTKVSAHLLQARELLREGASSLDVQQQVPVLRATEDLFEVEIRFRELDAEIADQVRQIGVQVVSVWQQFQVIDALIDLELLDEVAAMPSVAVIQPQYGAQLLTGSVDNQADVSIKSNQARSNYGVDGSGLTVGVLSDTFHRVIGGSLSGSGCAQVLTGSSPQTSGDLPTPVYVIDPGPGSGIDEGAGMAELIHDLAPGADLMFHSGFNSVSDFAQGITDLRNCGADVIVDDIIYFAEPMFQDGPIAQAAQASVDAGVPYYSSAGNQATRGVDEMFVDANPAVDDMAWPPTADDLHDFGSGNPFASITLNPGCGVRAVLQWNEPFDAPLGVGATSDLDLMFYPSESAGSSVFAYSASQQGCGAGTPPGGDPLELIAYVNESGSSLTGYLAVSHYCGNQDDLHFRIATYGINCSLGGTGLTFESGIFDQSQVYGHAAAAGAEAVAAVFYGEIDSGGTLDPPSSQIDVEPFSSLGGNIPFYFDGSGDPLPGAPQTRFKPEISAPDGTNTTFFGSDIGYDADSHPNFFGTSAAAPHAAAVAALALDGDPTLTPAGLRTLLASTATDIESAGVDFLSGAGLIDAEAAVDEATDILNLNPLSHDYGSVSVGGSGSRDFTLTNTNLGSAAVTVSNMTLSDTTNYTLDVNGGGDPCGSTAPVIASGDSCTVSVDFGPTTTGSLNATFSVYSDEPTLMASLSGVGTDVSCVGPVDLVLTGETWSTTQVYEACNSITAGPSFTITATGDVTFKARNLIELRNGFSAQAGATFTADLDPTAGAP
jgi:hypothetical protein